MAGEANTRASLVKSPDLESPSTKRPLVAPAGRDGLSPAGNYLLKLQRAAGNRAVVDVLNSRTDAAVQRDIVDNDEPTKVLLDRFNRPEERAQVIGASIYQKLWLSDALDGRSFDDVYDLVFAALSTVDDVVANPSAAVKMSELIETKFARLAGASVRHEAFMRKTLLAPHEAVKAPQVRALFGHYNFFDDNMIWRFTTRPSTEFVYIAPGTTHEEIGKVVAAHSGGADKSNPNVKTLSFGRNLGALMGVAASKGGDKKVLNIADKAAYVYGIDINSLGGKGITAHPATARMISLFETEYVLVCTPGDKARTLDELATVKYNNPFKANAIASLLSRDEYEGGTMKGVEASMGSVEAENVQGVGSMDISMVHKILAYAKKAKKAATPQWASVQDKEPIRGQGQIDNAMTPYNRDLR